MSKREIRVINAFLNCIKHGEYTVDYAITLIEDNQRYGWLSDTAKDYFYEQIDAMMEVEIAEDAPIDDFSTDDNA
jgi:hypothetical protein